MRCKRARELMDRYVSEGLPPDEREPFETHLRDCRDCQEHLAKFQDLVATLRSVPVPPIPHGFAERVMAKARQEFQRPQPSVVGRSTFSRWPEHVGAARAVNALGAVAAGLLLGLVLGQQTWQHTASANGAEQSIARVDADSVYALDYLSGTPRGSFTETYLSLTSVSNEQEF